MGKAMRLVLLGPPGAGKGVQAEILSKEFGIPQVASGDILRAAVEKNEPEGLEAKHYMERGELVPDELVTQIIGLRLSQPDCQTGFILDGFPRTLNQAQMLDDILEKQNLMITCVFDLEASEEIIIQRLSGRRICKNCAQIFHIVNMPPKLADKCDNCGGELYQREDDKPETIRHRLQVYRTQTQPLVKYYKKKSLLRTINADDVREATFKSILAVLKGCENR